VSFCSSVRAASVSDPQGSRCASGEKFFSILFNKYHNFYPYGTWGGGYGSMATVSEGGYCYAPSGLQRRDGDNTDITVGCYCWDNRYF